MTRGIILAACALLFQVHAAGQTPLTDGTPQLRIGVEARRDRILYDTFLDPGGPVIVSGTTWS